MSVDERHAIACAWCGEAVGLSEQPGSHGLCDSCFEELEGVPSLEAEELDRLPFGVITLDPDGIVLSYSDAEQELSGRSADEVVGKRFFREIAPCTRVRAFEGRWTRFLESSATTEQFHFTFPFPGRSVDVRIVFVRGTESVSVLVRRREQGSESPDPPRPS